MGQRSSGLPPNKRKFAAACGANGERRVFLASRGGPKNPSKLGLTRAVFCRGNRKDIAPTDCCRSSLNQS